MKYSTATISNIGGRKTNEDYCDYKIQNDFTCWVLADGLGGYRGGEVAAKIAVESLMDTFAESPGVGNYYANKYIAAAQQAVLKAQDETPALFSMRTTLVLMLADKDKVIWGHVGDSRLYWFRDGHIIHRTRDHSVSQSLADAGYISPEQIRFHADRNRLLRSLGNQGEVRAAIEKSAKPIKAGDAFLLCTDGLWEYILEEEMEADLAQASNPVDWLKLMEIRIKERVIGNNDNYSAIGVMVLRD